MADLKSLPEIIQTAYSTIISGSERFPIELADDEIGVLLGLEGWMYADAIGSTVLGRMYITPQELSAASLVELETGAMRDKRVWYTTGIYHQIETAVAGSMRSNDFSYEFPYPIAFSRAPYLSTRYAIGSGRVYVVLHYVKNKASRELISKLQVKYL